MKAAWCSGRADVSLMDLVFPFTPSSVFVSCSCVEVSELKYDLKKSLCEVWDATFPLSTSFPETRVALSHGVSFCL